MFPLFVWSTSGQYTIDVPVFAAVAATVAGLLITVGTTMAIMRAAGLRATLALQHDSIETITKINDELRQAMLDQEREAAKRELECERRIAVLEGRLHALTSEFSHMVVAAVVATLKEMQSLPFPSTPATGVPTTKEHE